MLNKLKEEAEQMEKLHKSGKVTTESTKKNSKKDKKAKKDKKKRAKKSKKVQEDDFDDEFNEDIDDSEDDLADSDEDSELDNDSGSAIDITEQEENQAPRINKTRALFNMYFTMAQHYLTRGKNLTRMNLDDESMQIEHDRIFTKSGVKCVWTFKSTGEFLPENFFGELKTHMDNSIGGSRTSIILTPVGGTYKVDFNSKEVRSKVDHWAMMKRVAESREAKQNEADKLKDTTDFKKRLGIKRMFNSFTKYKAYMTKQFKFAKFYVAVEGITYNNDEMQLYQSALEGFCLNHEVTLRKVTKLHDYLGAMSLTTKKGSKFKKTLDYIILSDLDIAELDSYSQGSVGSKIGVYAGTDIKTSFGVYLNFTESTKAQNILITAITGGGKSFFIKCLLLFHALCGHRLAIMDYEGKEYIKLVPWLKGKTLSMGIEDSICVNTLKIPDVIGMSLSEAKAVFQESYNATERIFRILANVGENHQEDDIQILFQDIMKQLYSQTIEGPIVKEQPVTYSRSKHLNYFKLYKVLEDFKSHDTFIARHGDLADIVCKRLEPYWGEEGNKRYLFEKEQEIQDLYDSKILHFNFGMQNSTDDSAPPKETLLKISMMTYVFAKYHAYNLKHGKFTVNLMEEFQRSGSSPMLLRTVNHWITGGRKGNIVNYIVTNAIGVLVNNKNPDAQAIKDNITTFMIGKCRQTAREQLVEAFDLQEFQETMFDISKNPEFTNCFLLIFDTGHTRDKVVTLMQIAPEFHEDDYFKTRREEKYEEWEI